MLANAGRNAACCRWPDAVACVFSGTSASSSSRLRSGAAVARKARLPLLVPVQQQHWQQRRWFILPDNLQKAVEAGAEQGCRLVNGALAVMGSRQEFCEGGRGRPHLHEQNGTKAPSSGNQGEQKQKEEGSEEEGCQHHAKVLDSIFWNPYSPGSPFGMDRGAFLAQCLAKDVDPLALVPEGDVESYIDSLLEEHFLSNSSLPAKVGRMLYIRVVRIVQRVIINAVALLEGDVLGRHFRLLKQPSLGSRFRRTSAGLDQQVLRLIARRTVHDHIIDGKYASPYLAELGLPLVMIERLYEDIISLTVRLVFDVSLTFKLRCLGHTLTCRIEADEFLQNAPGWEVALEHGAFGIFDDKEKRSWASMFVDDLLRDPRIQVPELPDAAQRHLYTRIVLMMLNLVETAMNHARMHVAGLSFRPALLD